MLIGNLGKDPEIQLVDGNVSVVKVPLATTEMYKDRNGKTQSQTEWHTVVLWRGLAEMAGKYLKKGSLIYVEGRLRYHAWEDKTGVKKYITEIIADNVVMLDKRPNNISSSSDDKDLYDADMNDIDPNENLPF
jgi:single-strand DNA-binding protein